MSRRSENAFILVCNVSLEYEKTEVTSGFFYKNAEERARLVAAERKVTDDKVRKIIDLKRKVYEEKKAELKAKSGSGDKEPELSFIVINQKGIDPLSLELFQKDGIVGIRRAKKRNMERLARACGGYAVNSVDDLSPDCLGFAKLVYEHQLGEEVYTFVEGCKNATSCTILIKGPNDHTIAQLKDAVRDGIRAVYNAIEDKALVPGGGAFELAANRMLLESAKEYPAKIRLGVLAFAEAMLVIPKTLAINSGFDPQETVMTLLDESKNAGGALIGLDVYTGKAMLPDKRGVWDNLRVKKQFITLGSLIAVKLLLVDEVIRAGRKMGKG